MNTAHTVRSSLINTLKSDIYRGQCLMKTQVSSQCRQYSTRISSLFAAHNPVKQILPHTLRSIRQTTTAATPVGVSTITPQSQKIVGRWLLTCAGMCFGAVMIGGITRLTESGLSMTNWHLIKGMKPPRTQEEWKAEFERYKTFPEYKYVHRELTLEEFKNIFFWEYLHRMWGRTIGVVFAVPALYFLKKGWVSKPLKPRLLVYGSLLLFQGLLGWYMVKSGLEEKPDSMDIPRVSQYRLCAHLSSAMVLYSLFLWQGLSHVLTPNNIQNFKQISRFRGLAHASMALVFFTAMSGAFVAGLDAGLTYNSWPKMANRWIPDDLLAFSPKWRNIFENPTTVQFNHRHLGEFTAVSVIGLWFIARRTPLPARAMMAANALAAMAFIQVGLGVTTLLTYVPVPLAAAHQGGALTMLSIAIWLNHELRKIPK